jgi:hypothetical protein
MLLRPAHHKLRGHERRRRSQCQKADTENVRSGLRRELMVSAEGIGGKRCRLKKGAKQAHFCATNICGITLFPSGKIVQRGSRSDRLVGICSNERRNFLFSCLGLLSSCPALLPRPLLVALLPSARSLPWSAFVVCMLRARPPLFPLLFRRLLPNF